MVVSSKERDDQDEGQRKEETESEKPRPKKADPISEKAREPKLAFQFCHKDVRRKMT